MAPTGADMGELVVMSDDLSGQLGRAWSGSLPPVAAARIAEARRSGTWSSALSTGEFAAIRSVGFEPVGQVMGSAVYQVARLGPYFGYYDCGFPTARYRLGGWVAEVALSGAGSAARALVQVLLDARYKALSRMRAECAALGGDGVVSAILTIAPFPAAPNCLEFQVIGTAVRAQGSVRAHRPFTSHVDGEGFAKLISAGWVPVDLLVGLSIGVRHDDYQLRRQTGFMAGNQEIDGWTQLVARTRRDARARIREQAAASGAQGLVLGSSDLQVWSETCQRAKRNDSEGEDHIAEATLVGTAIAAFDTRHAPTSRTLTVMPLDSRRKRLRRRIDRDLNSYGTDPYELRTKLAELSELGDGA
jgi:uncharacterized protein YbjQ (UPF0145 family)